MASCIPLLLFPVTEVVILLVLSLVVDLVEEALALVQSPAHIPRGVQVARKRAAPCAFRAASM